MVAFTAVADCLLIDAVHALLTTVDVSAAAISRIWRAFCLPAAYAPMPTAMNT